MPNNYQLLLGYQNSMQDKGATHMLDDQDTNYMMENSGITRRMEWNVLEEERINEENQEGLFVLPNTECDTIRRFNEAKGVIQPEMKCIASARKETVMNIICRPGNNSKPTGHRIRQPKTY